MTETLRIRTFTGLHGRIGMRLVGALDAGGATVLMEEMSRRGPGPGDNIVMHLEDVTVLDPAGVNALAYVEGFLLARGAHLTIASANDEVTARLQLAGMERLLAAEAHAPPTGPLPVGGIVAPQAS